MLPYNLVPPSRPLDFYEALGVDRRAPMALIKSSYRELIHVRDPYTDTSIDEAAKQAAIGKFHLVTQAYLILRNEAEREQYDEQWGQYDNQREQYDNQREQYDIQRERYDKQREQYDKQREQYDEQREQCYYQRHQFDVWQGGAVLLLLLQDLQEEAEKEKQRLINFCTHIRDRIRELSTRGVVASESSLVPSLATVFLEAKNWLKEHGTKWKQGLAGFANNSSISAIADTGSQKTVISASYAEKLGLRIGHSPSSFTLGNSRRLNSIGTVSLRWSFADSPKEAVSIICHVLPHCIYDLILGNGFLTVTETMSRFRHRLTRCLFPVATKHATFAFLGETCQRLEGVLADEHDVLAVPDSGAERNVMDMQFAIDHGFKIRKETERRNWLQFADGSCEKTMGQVDTYWTFATRERVPVTFEILENCCSDVVIGEEILTHHNVFDYHASSLISLDASIDSYELAPFDFISRWQRHLGPRRGGAPKNGQNGQNHTLDPHVEERRRRDIWNFEHKYGENATTIEKELEMARRTRYDSSTTAARMPVIPSIPTAPSGR